MTTCVDALGKRPAADVAAYRAPAYLPCGTRVALLGVERLGLALYALADRVAPDSPQQPA